MNIEKLNGDVYDAVAKNLGLELRSVEAYKAVRKMGAKEAWQRYCVWNGLLGNYHQQLATAYENIKKSAK